jgi:ABC-2 type transport system ATP-binding protein
VCDRVLIINKGRIVAEDTPERLQARLMGTQRLAVKVWGEPDGLDDSLAAIKGVCGVVRTAEGFEVEVDPGRDVRAEVARTIVDADYDLLELRPIGLSLEDIFLQLTRDEIPPPAFSEEPEGEEEEL